MIALIITGVLYVLLGIWCTVNPEGTAAALGYALPGDSGRSEYFTVYGGLDMGLGLGFLACCMKKEFVKGGLVFGFVIAACLVLYRSISIFLYPEFSSVITSIAVTEWVLLGLFVWALKKELKDSQIILETQ